MRIQGWLQLQDIQSESWAKLGVLYQREEQLLSASRKRRVTDRESRPDRDTHLSPFWCPRWTIRENSERAAVELFLPRARDGNQVLHSADLSFLVHVFICFLRSLSPYPTAGPGNSVTPSGSKEEGLAKAQSSVLIGRDVVSSRWRSSPPPTPCLSSSTGLTLHCHRSTWERKINTCNVPDLWSSDLKREPASRSLKVPG